LRKCRANQCYSRLDADDEILHAAAVAAGHAVHLVHDERLLLHRAVEADSAVGDHLLHHVGTLAVQARFHIGIRLAHAPHRRTVSSRARTEPGRQNGMPCPHLAARVAGVHLQHVKPQSAAHNLGRARLSDAGWAADEHSFLGRVLPLGCHAAVTKVDSARMEQHRKEEEELASVLLEKT
jgi:hypothetical protein